MLSLLVLLSAGCGSAPRFVPNEIAIAQQKLTPEQREQVAGVLADLFGTPDEPRVPQPLADLLDLEQLKHAAGTVASHTPGETVGLYRRHCAVCHGLSGDGAGPTALYQTPYPRDFRQGVFKYKSTYRDTPPTDDDLARLLRHGLGGTAMPSFALLPEDELQSLVEYTKYLAIRGQTEEALYDRLGANLAFDPTAFEGEMAPALAAPWRKAKSLVVPASSALPSSEEQFAQWAEEGSRLFHDAQRANCIKCHGQGGAGGVMLEDHDLWSGRRFDFIQTNDQSADSAEQLHRQIEDTAGDRGDFLRQQLAASEQELDERRIVELAALPPRLAVARQFTRGALRSVRTPEDLFRRIHQGIPGSPMPAVGPTTPQGTGALSNDEVWKLVAYVMQLTETRIQEDDASEQSPSSGGTPPS